MDSADSAALIAVGGTLAGGVLGWLGTWATTSASNRRADARDRDQQFVRLARTADQILIETGLVAINIFSMPPDRQSAFAEQKMQNSILPMMYDLDGAAVAMTMGEARQLRVACEQLYDVTRELCLMSVLDPAGQQRREEAMRTALASVRTARDLDQARWWRFRYRSRKVAALDKAAKELASRSRAVPTAGPSEAPAS